MEGPFSFDIWILTCESGKDSVKACIAETFPMLSKIEIHKIVQRGIRDHKYIHVFSNLGWENVLEFRKALPEYNKAIKVVVFSYTPDTCSNYCKVHEIFYDVEECPICCDFYIKRNIDGLLFH